MACIRLRAHVPAPVLVALALIGVTAPVHAQQAVDAEYTRLILEHTRDERILTEQFAF